MKKILTLLFLICLSAQICFALGLEATFENRFKKEDGFNNYSFIALSKEEYKKLNKSEKKIYKNMEKAYKYWQKALEAKNQNSEIKYSKKALKFYELKPAIVNLMYIYDNNKDYKNAYIYGYKLVNSGRSEDKIFYYDFARYNLYLNMNESAINAADEHLKLPNITNSAKSNCYLVKMLANFNLHNFDQAIAYAKEAVNLDKNSETLTWETLYKTYLAKNNKTEAHKIAHKLYSKSIPDKYTAALRIAESSESDNIKLKFYTIAKANTESQKEKSEINLLINEIDEKNLDLACKNTKGYVSRPKWADISANDHMTLEQSNERYENYHVKLNACLQYRNEDFKRCLADLKTDEEKISQRLFAEHQEKLRRIEERERIYQMQMINSNLMHANYLQQRQNDELRDMNYNLNRKGW